MVTTVLAGVAREPPPRQPGVTTYSRASFQIPGKAIEFTRGGLDIAGHGYPSFEMPDQHKGW